jgi:hypothetical protein
MSSVAAQPIGEATPRHAEAPRQARRGRDVVEPTPQHEKYVAEDVVSHRRVGTPDEVPQPWPVHLGDEILERRRTARAWR